MPEMAEKSEALRKAEKSQVYPFISCSVYEVTSIDQGGGRLDDMSFDPQFERRLTLTRFEEMLREVESERTWDFGNRVYMERHNKNTLMQ